MIDWGEWLKKDLMDILLTHQIFIPSWINVACRNNKNPYSDGGVLRRAKEFSHVYLLFLSRYNFITIRISYVVVIWATDREI